MRFAKLRERASRGFLDRVGSRESSRSKMQCQTSGDSLRESQKAGAVTDTQQASHAGESVGAWYLRT